MRLWTIQSPIVYDIIADAGTYRAIWGKIIPWPAGATDAFDKAYRWMAEQMNSRNLGLGEYAPIWAWAWKDKPDLRRVGHGDPGSALVRMELEVPDDLVLLSDFDLWHFVLNNEFISFDGLEYKPQQDGEEIKGSWDRVFQLRDTTFLAKKQIVQAVIPKIDLPWVQQVRPFKAR